MRQTGRRVLTAIAVLLILFIGSSAWASEGGIIYYERNIKINDLNRTVKVVEVDLNNQYLELEVVISHDRLGGAESFMEMVKRKNAAAAINANFFHAYSDLEPIGTIAQKGEIIYLEGGDTTVGITEKNEILFLDTSTIVKGTLDGKDKNEYIDGRMVFNLWNAWYINCLYINENSVALFTPERGENINLSWNGLCVVVEKGRVTGITETPAVVNIPNDGFLIFYGEKSASDYKNYVQERFKKGRRVDYTYTLRDLPDNSFWEKAEHALTAGPRLLVDGEIAAAPAREWEEKIATGRGQRSALGLTSDHKMLMVTVSSVTIGELAQIMKSLHAYQALNLDGGASSGLYYKDRIVTSPGRALSTVLVVKSRDGLSEIKVVIDGQPLNFDVSPVIVEGRTLVPLRAIFEALGAEVKWDPQTNTVTASKKDNTIILKSGDKLANVNGKDLQLDVAATNIGGRIMVPTRFIAESLGANVGWDNTSRKVIIDTK